MDIGEELKAKELPIPTAQRNNIFVASPEVELADRMQQDWLRGDNSAVFVFPDSDNVEPATFCGIALFVLPFSYMVPRRFFTRLEPFFKRGGSEANVFEYCPVRRIFIRRERDWFDGRIVEPGCITGCVAEDYDRARLYW